MKKLIKKLLPRKMWNWLRLEVGDIRDFGWLAFMPASVWEKVWENRMEEYYEKEHGGYYDLSNTDDNRRYWKKVKELDKEKSFIMEEKFYQREVAT